MTTLTDHQLVEQIQLGQSEALGQLFDRYGESIFDFLARVVGDPDEAVHLVVDVFTRFPKSAAGIPEHESVRGVLYSLAHEIALASLQHKGWGESLPPSSPSAAPSSDLANDIWQAARALPAAQRAVLAIVEQQALSPMEEATALGVARHALPDVAVQARRSFNQQFDLHAQTQGKPAARMIDAERVPGLQRRMPDPNASLFTYLPALVLTDTARVRVRNQIVGSLGQPPQSAGVLPTPLPEPRLEAEPTDKTLVPILLGVALVIALLAAMLALVAIHGNQQTASLDTNPPVIKQIAPQDGAILPPGTPVIVQAIYGDDQGVDVSSVRLLLDNHDVTPQSAVSDTSLSFASNAGPGQHVAVVELKDVAGNSTSKTWIFTILASTSTPSPTATYTPLPTTTSGPTLTPAPTQTNAPTATPRPTATNTPQPVLPDLVVTDISLSPNNEIVYVIRNSGAGDVTQPFLIQIYVDNASIDSNRKVSSLGAGQQVSLFVPNYFMSGTHAVTVRVNSDQAIQESNYRDNELTRALYGPTPIPTPSPSPSPSATPAK
jgi:RNA polymerase sigma-70 factor, ECF subfamily